MIQGKHLLAATFALMLAGASVQAAPPPIPELALWEKQMVEYGRQNCQKLEPGSADRLGSAYYDAERIYYQIAAYTGDPTWKYCAGLAESAYRDEYVFPNNGSVAGFMNFTHGLLMDFQRTGDTKSKDAIIALSQRAAFAMDGTPLEWTAPTSSSREVAYVIENYLNAEAVGEPRRARLADMVSQAFGHMDQWFVSKTAPYVRPFMVGLTAEALIQWHSVSGDSRVLPILRIAMDYLWDCCWLPDVQGFTYTDRESNDNSGGRQPAVDLNLLIAPAFAWLYAQTGDPRYQERGDQIFAGAVRQGYAFLVYPKQYNQNYRWSFDYVKWRLNGVTPTSGTPQAPASPSDTAPPTPTSSPPSSTPNISADAPTPSLGPTIITPDMPRGLIKKKRRS